MNESIPLLSDLQGGGSYVLVRRCNNLISLSMEGMTVKGNHLKGTPPVAPAYVCDSACFLCALLVIYFIVYTTTL